MIMNNMRAFLLIISFVVAKSTFCGGQVVNVSNEINTATSKSDALEVITRVNVKDGWHIYGADAIKEIPTRLKWSSGTDDLSCEINWPNVDENGHLPQNFEIQSFFHDQNALKSKIVNGTLSWLACKTDKCLPGKNEFQVDCSHIIKAGNPVHNNADQYAIITLVAGAFLGGILLNFMPCIFPVLGIKIFKLLQANDIDRKSHKAHSVAYTAGIICTFFLLGASIIGLRSVGHKLGWGFQLQNVPFLIFLSYLLVALALNFLGLFEFNIQFSSKISKRTPIISNFLEGFFITILSTPCSAPFMGASVGFALTQPSIYTIAILLAMGIGLALPFQLLTFFPALARALPKPGAWMETLKQLLAFPLFGTAIWLLWLLTNLTSVEMLFLTIIGCLTVAFSMWLFSATKAAHKFSSARVIILLASLACAWIIPYRYHNSYAANNARQTKFNNSDFWHKFSESDIETIQNSGQAVFVDVTADWCITCKANESIVLASSEVKAAFEKYNVYAMKADWTSQNTNITEFLEKFGFAGVPLYAFFPPNKAAAPVILPSLLTQDNVIETIKSYCNSKQ